MKLNLKYFDIAGRGEVLRILLNGNPHIEFTDTRIPFSDWKTVQPTTPLGKLPLLIQDDNLVFTQSTSLYRYAAKLVDLYPSEPLAALIVDETMDVLNDLLSQIPGTANLTEDEARTQRHHYRDTHMKRALRWIESRIDQFGTTTTNDSDTPTKTTVCGTPSVADLLLLTYRNSLTSHFFTHLDDTVLQEFPLILQVTDAMKQHPIVVKAYNN